jgi:hypothetical protein
MIERLMLKADHKARVQQGRDPGRRGLRLAAHRRRIGGGVGEASQRLGAAPGRDPGAEVPRRSGRAAVLKDDKPALLREVSGDRLGPMFAALNGDPVDVQAEK